MRSLRGLYIILPEGSSVEKKLDKIKEEFWLLESVNCGKMLAKYMINKGCKICYADKSSSPFPDTREGTPL